MESTVPTQRDYAGTALIADSKIYSITDMKNTPGPSHKNNVGEKLMF